MQSGRFDHAMPEFEEFWRVDWQWCQHAPISRIWMLFEKTPQVTSPQNQERTDFFIQ